MRSNTCAAGVRTGVDGQFQRAEPPSSVFAQHPSAPPSALSTLYQRQDLFREKYLDEFPGFYCTADAGMIDADGYISIMARTDDIINVAGHRLSTGAMEEVLAEHSDVAECAVIGVEDQLKGQLPVGFLVLNAGTTMAGADIVGEVVQMVRDRIGPVAAFKQAAVVERLPKTRSGKILRGTMQAIADNKMSSDLFQAFTDKTHELEKQAKKIGGGRPEFLQMVLSELGQIQSEVHQCSVLLEKRLMEMRGGGGGSSDANGNSNDGGDGSGEGASESRDKKGSSSDSVGSEGKGSGNNDFLANPMAAVMSAFSPKGNKQKKGSGGSSLGGVDAKGASAASSLSSSLTDGEQQQLQQEQEQQQELLQQP